MGLDVGRLVLLMQIEPGWQVVIRYNDFMLGHCQPPFSYFYLGCLTDRIN